MPTILDHIDEIKEYVDKLDDAGIPKKNMHISEYGHIGFDTIEVRSSNNVLFHTLSEEDANIIIDILRKFAVSDYDNFKTAKGSDTVYFTENIKGFLENIKKNREEFKHLL